MFRTIYRYQCLIWIFLGYFSAAGCGGDGAIKHLGLKDVEKPEDVHQAEDILSGLLDVAWVGDVDAGSVEDAPIADIPSPPADLALDAPEADGSKMPPGMWRSVLYPAEWSPGFEGGEGRFLHDFSFAGYGNGEVEPASPDGTPIFDVVADFQAEAGGVTDCTSAIQAAIDAASDAGGGVVFFPEGLFRVDGVLRVAASKVVLRGEGPALSKVFFSSSDGLDYSGHLIFAGTLTTTVEVPVVADAKSLQTYLEVESAEGFSVGDDVQVGWNISPEFVTEHEMDFVWKAFNDTWQPFFHRNIVEVDGSSNPPRLVLDVPLRYPAKTRDGASVRLVDGYLHDVGVEDIGMANATDWETAWEHMQVHLLRMVAVKDSWIRNLWSFTPPTAPTSGLGKNAHLQNSGLMVKSSKRVTVADSRLSFDQNRGSGGCGYLFEVRQSSEILFRDCVGRAGRHNFIQNWGFGATGIVWLRVHSLEGENVFSNTLGFGLPTTPDFHHSLATANLIDSSVLDDGWSAVNRGDWSSGAGHSATENVFWNTQGEGTVRSLQYAWGYVIGTQPTLAVSTKIPQLNSGGTEPEDYTEGLGEGGTLYPSSLYEDQLARRLNKSQEE